MTLITLEKLRLWSTNEQIIQTIHHSYQLAYELTEFLNMMIQPANLLINNPLIIINSHEDEVSRAYIHNETKSGK